MTLDQYKTEYANARGRWQGESAALVRRREEAFSRFVTLGFPTLRDEEWRFTSVAPIASGSFALAPSTAADARSAPVMPFQFSDAFSAELVFVNGTYVKALSKVGALPAGSQVGSLAEYLAGRTDGIEAHLTRLASFDRRAFVALNTAFFSDGAYLHIPAHAVVEKPIHVAFISAGAATDRPLMSHPRLLAVLGDDSQTALVESYAGHEGVQYFTNPVTEIVLGNNAVLDHYRLQHESTDAYHVGAVFLRSARSATCSSHSVSLGGALVRNDVIAVLDGEGAECTLNGLYLADGQRLVDNHTTIDHAMPHCGSREVYKGILADRARGVFNGKIIVRPDAQKTDAKQTNRALLLSENAQVNSKPELEIFANDVKCTHGAAVGQLDEDAVFYLRSRGLGLAEARHMLIHAFLGDVLHRLPIASIRAGVEAVLERHLGRALAAVA
jgi:Fe-S cluster assembly protein SufD